MKTNYWRAIVGLLLLQQTIVGLGETLPGTSSGTVQGEAPAWRFDGATFLAEVGQSFHLGSFTYLVSSETEASQTNSNLRLPLSLNLKATPPLSFPLQLVSASTEDSPSQQLTLASRAVWDNLLIGDAKFNLVLTLASSNTIEPNGTPKINLMGQFLPHLAAATEIVMTLGNAVGGSDLSLVGDGTTLYS